MNKELTPLEAFCELKTYLEDVLFGTRESKAFGYSSTSQYLMPFIEQVETALKDYEKKTKLAKEYADVNNVAKRLKAFEILKQFDAFRVIQVQGQWFIMLGDVFVKSPKIPITEEQASALMEVLV